MVGISLAGGLLGQFEVVEPANSAECLQYVDLLLEVTQLRQLRLQIICDDIGGAGSGPAEHRGNRDDRAVQGDQVHSR